MTRPQRRGQKIAMTADEADAFLAGQRTVRLATVGHDGTPHNSPLWFVWDGSALWLNSIVRSQRHVNALRNPRASAVVDAGHGFGELQGVELIGTLEPVGDSPRTGEPDAELARPEALWSEKYGDGSGFRPDGRHAWLRLRPEKMVSWDMGKLNG